ncbi:MAG TPA: type II toxin-antitoxin system RelE/ParE family toxin [Bryobacterales bacterium]|nr:type II toxin-antitoxin system RelE/ParE family toxin [Bryobacterales bacterium]
MHRNGLPSRAISWPPADQFLPLGDAVYVLHAFQKKSTKGISTPRRDIELIRERLKRAVALESERRET